MKNDEKFRLLFQKLANYLLSTKKLGKKIELDLIEGLLCFYAKESKYGQGQSWDQIVRPIANFYEKQGYFVRALDNSIQIKKLCIKNGEKGYWWGAVIKVQGICSLNKDNRTQWNVSFYLN